MTSGCMSSACISSDCISSLIHYILFVICMSWGFIDYLYKFNHDAVRNRTLLLTLYISSLYDSRLSTELLHYLKPVSILLPYSLCSQSLSPCLYCIELRCYSHNTDTLHSLFPLSLSACYCSFTKLFLCYCTNRFVKLILWQYIIRSAQFYNQQTWLGKHQPETRYSNQVLGCSR